MPVSADQFRGALRRWASGVSVVTTRRDAGIRGITVSSFCSLSLDPPLILICVARTAVSHGTIQEQRCFGVNFLRSDQLPLAELAAGRSGERGSWLAGAAWRTAVTSAPLLVDCLGWLDCALVGQPDGGDHTIFLGRVEEAGGSDGSPLLWFGSGYRALAEGGASVPSGGGATPRRAGPPGRRPTRRRTRT